MKSLFVSLLVSLVSLSASATAISAALYDTSLSVLHLQVHYNGGLKTHEFYLEWGKCQVINGQRQVSARLLDTGWEDTGQEEISQLLSFDLSHVKCKPALLTIRSGRHSHVTLEIQ